MGQNQWDTAAAVGPLVYEVDPNPIQVRPEVLVAVQFPLPGSPVKTIYPVRQQSPQEAELGALPPVRPRNLVRPAGGADPLPEVGQYRLVDRDPERLDRKSVV